MGVASLVDITTHRWVWLGGCGLAGGNHHTGGYDLVGVASLVEITTLLKEEE